MKNEEYIRLRLWGLNDCTQAIVQAELHLLTKLTRLVADLIIPQTSQVEIDGQTVKDSQEKVHFRGRGGKVLVRYGDSKKHDTPASNP